MNNDLVDMKIPATDDFSWVDYKSIPIVDNGERLIPLSTSQHLVTYPFYAKMGIANAIPECFVRETVFEKLHHAARALPDCFKLVVLDGWRPFSVQQHFFDSLINILRKSFPNHDDQHLFNQAKSLVSPPSSDKLSPSPHLTGGSVDVTLCDTNGRLLDMGTEFDEASKLSWTDAFENLQGHEQARFNRRVLYHAMMAAGFTNLPSEWWHFDYGNQLWSYRKNQSEAFYGISKPRDIIKQWENEIVDNQFI